MILKWSAVSLLVFGLAWGGALQLSSHLRGALRPVVLAQYKKLSPDPNHAYTQAEVESHIRETAIAMADKQGWPGVPPLLVLSGAVLLCVSRQAGSRQSGA